MLVFFSLDKNTLDSHLHVVTMKDIMVTSSQPHNKNDSIDYVVEERMFFANTGSPFDSAFSGVPYSGIQMGIDIIFCIELILLFEEASNGFVFDQPLTETLDRK